jgi:hypothetical protein
MPRISKEQHLAKIHQDALTEFDEIQGALRDERLQCLQDRRFYSISGAQWEGNLGEQFENKPKFEVNKIHLAVIRIINEYRNNRIDVEFVSKDGSKNDRLADFCAGLYRADVQDSAAEEAFDNAFEEAVGGGFGAVRLRNVYEDDEDDENESQRIMIEPIYDADASVYFDLNAKRQDKSDAKRCFVITSMSRQAYEAEYGDEVTSWPKDIQQLEFDWETPDVVYVCEYYRVDEVGETVYTYRALDGTETKHYASEFERDETIKAELEDTGHVLVRQKRVKRRRVRKYILSGGGILEDVGYIAGKHIPIVPVYGKRWFVDNVERCMGHVRLAKDAQRLKNMQLSKLGEISALSPIEKPIFTPQQMAGHELMWAQDNLKDYPYLLTNPLTGADGQIVSAGPAAYTKPPAIPPAMAALLQVTEQDMADILGNQQQADKMVSNISGKAVEMIQERIDAQAFIYMSNQAKMIKRVGEVWLSMAKDVYFEEGRKVKIVDDQEEMSSAELMKPTINEKTGAIEYENDLSSAAFDVSVSIGPTSRSKRQATLRSLINMIQISDDPETRQVLTGMAMLNMEGEGVQSIRDYFRKKLVRIGVIKPTDEEMAQMQAEAQNQPQDPNAVFLQAAAEEAMAKASQARASVIKTVADSELARAKTVETLGKVDASAQDQALQMAQLIGGGLGQPEQIQQPAITPPMQ